MYLSVDRLDYRQYILMCGLIKAWTIANNEKSTTVGKNYLRFAYII